MHGLLVLVTAMTANLVSGQSTSATQTTSLTSTSPTSTTAEATWTNPVIASLWSDAASLISTYYPSSTITNVGSLTWPSVVVLGSATLTVTPGASTFATITSSTPATTPASTPASTPTSTSSTDSTKLASTTDDNTSVHTDKRLGIALGVGIGCVALGILIFLVWFVHRRKSRAGSSSARERLTPSDDEIQTWRGPQSTTLIHHPEKYAAEDATSPFVPPSGAHSAFTRNYTNNDGIEPTEYSNGASNPFQTPYESYAGLAASDSRRASLHELHGESSMQMLNDRRPPSLITRAAMSAVRPSTPHTTFLMRDMTSPVSPISPADDVQRHDFDHEAQVDAHEYWREHSSSDFHDSGHTSLHNRSSVSNPFLSEEDDDALEPPPSIPSRSPRRRSSPVVHYPTENEISTFNFGLAGMHRQLGEQGVEDAHGEDGWRGQYPPPRKESTIGRHEMA